MRRTEAVIHKLWCSSMYKMAHLDGCGYGIMSRHYVQIAECFKGLNQLKED